MWFYLLVTKDSILGKVGGKTFFPMRNALDRSYRDRHLIHRLHRAVTLESDLYSGVRQKPLISKNVLDKDYNLEKISFAK